MTAFLSQTLFPTLLNMSLTAGIVILCVIAARLALKRAPKVFSYALWAVVLFRLLCPVSLPSGISLLGALDAPARQASPVVSTVTYVQPQRQPEAIQPQTEQVPVEPQTPASDSLAPVVPEQQATSTVDWAAVAAWVWLAGVLGMAGYSIFALLRLRRRLVGSLRLRDNIYLADHISTPFVLGLVRPRIYLPSTLTQGEMGYIIRHERYHIRHGDHVVKVLAFAGLCLHWFNPLVWAAFILAGKDMEMRCDEAVVRQLGERVKADYSASLLALATGRLTIAGTPLAFGEGDPKGRIRNLLRWKRPRVWLSMVAGVACVAVIAACASNPAGQNTGGSGQYQSVEDFAQQTLDSVKEVTYYKFSNGTATTEEATAQVTSTKLAWLDKQGELEGLAPEGTLEAWTFNYLVQIDAPAEDIALVGGMYEEDGWFDLEGQGGHNIVALRYPDGSYNVLYDQPVNDNLDFYGYHNSYEEAIYDWYVAEKGLDLPPYVEEWSVLDLGPSGEENINIPVHRYDGDGWYLYIPVVAWKQTSADPVHSVWVSEYDTGSAITVDYTKTNLADYLAGDTRGMTPAGDSGRVFEAQGDGWNYRYYYVEGAEGCWRITIQWQDGGTDGQPLTITAVAAPKVLALMAESFTPDSRITPAQTSASLLSGVTCGETPLTLTLLPEGGQAGEALKDCWNTDNGEGYYSGLADLTWRKYSTPAQEAPKGDGVTLAGPGWTLTAYAGLSAAAYDDGSGVIWLNPDSVEEREVYRILRGWYDEVEFQALGGNYDQQDQIVIPNTGQDYLAAAKAHCTALEERHLQASSGSSFCWTYVQCIVSPAEDDIPAFEDLPDNVYPFYLTTIFVPENEDALNHSMAGNTGEYTGNDPSVPKGAYEYGRCGFITLETDGWHGNLVGTGW
ncbi:hypothetical protein B5E56_12915 [Flavonifractor sp. An112]|uniref:M56 family metallopeptidase n=1 Tax=Flavonifractor sp. An112 TaxID=1965544 RepID=UPI000B39BF37|nr:M56 family metallopeptidase [Flavonifractor sp. An112]OUQ56376.1 hypothetical protein B5E56_12915 [Flavonifractor sp. An112]